jgi:CRISPR/Cas system-associated protein Cas5 (RAMP superfamily)
MKILLLILLLDTSECLVSVKNLKTCKTKIVRAFEVTRYNEKTTVWETVMFLKPNGKRMRQRRNRCVSFYESLR